MLRDKQELRIPGPVPVPPRVSLETARPMINHRGREFKQLLPQVLRRLRPIFGTKENQVLALTGSGTSGMEAAVANLVSPGDQVLVLVGGAFGERWVKLCKTYGALVKEYQFPWGEGADPDRIREILKENPNIVAVFATHNESSTGVLNDIAAISQARSGHQALLVVDAVSSLGGAPLAMDEWAVDFVVTASQKSLMVPPGLAFVAYSRRARHRMEQVTTPRFYFDLLAYEAMLEKGETPFTPNISNFFGLEEALDMIEEEGLENVFSRHLLMRNMVRAGIRALALPLLVEDRFASPTTTAVKPQEIDVPKFRVLVRDTYGVELAGGQGRLANDIFRIGHMGYATPLDMITCLAAIETALGKFGVATAAAQMVWQQHIGKQED